MKAIIEGVRYDTETAELLGEAHTLGNRGDYSYWEAALYRSPRAKRYFLAGSGGPMTMWAKRSGGMRSGGSGIKPLETAEAFEWAQAHLTDTEVEAAFSDMIEDA